jgi:hypothetical protein
LEVGVQRSQEPQLFPIEPLDLISANNQSSPSIELIDDLTSHDIPEQLNHIESLTDLAIDPQSSSQIQLNILNTNINNSIENPIPKSERIRFQSVLKQTNVLNTNVDNSIENSIPKDKRIRFQSTLKQTNENLIQYQLQIPPIQRQSWRTDRSQPIVDHQELSDLTPLPLVRSIPETEKLVSNDRGFIPQTNSDQQHLENPSRLNPVTNRESITNTRNTRSESPITTSTQQIRNFTNQVIEQIQPSNQSRLYLRATQASTATLAVVKPRLDVSTESQSNIQESISPNLAMQTQSEHRQTYEKSPFSIDDEPTIHITIGRVVVRGVTTPPSTQQFQPSQPTPVESRLSLEDYLRQREGGSR